jgi:hypothetical protein
MHIFHSVCLKHTKFNYIILPTASGEGQEHKSCQEDCQKFLKVFHDSNLLFISAKCKVHNAKLFLCEGDEEMLINFAFSI